MVPIHQHVYLQLCDGCIFAFSEDISIRTPAENKVMDFVVGTHLLNPFQQLT
jgi:hypothetical protein